MKITRKEIQKRLDEMLDECMSDLLDNIQSELDKDDRLKEEHSSPKCEEHEVDMMRYFVGARWNPHPRRIEIQKEYDKRFNVFTGNSKHDTQVILNRVREREKQRLEARCCPTCGLPIECILETGWFKFIFPCNHSFVNITSINQIYKERCLDGLRKEQRSVADEEAINIERGNR